MTTPKSAKPHATDQNCSLEYQQIVWTSSRLLPCIPQGYDPCHHYIARPETFEQLYLILINRAHLRQQQTTRRTTFISAPPRKRKGC